MNNLMDFSLIIISDFCNYNIVLIFRLLSKSIKNQYTDNKLILESFHKYHKKLQHVKEIISKYISIENDISIRSKKLTIEEFKTLNTLYEKRINNSCRFLMSNKALVINNFGEDTVLYFCSITGKLIHEAFGENYVEIAKIVSTDKEIITELKLTNYKIYNGYIYVLIIICVDIGYRCGKAITNTEANALKIAFGSRMYIE